MLAMHLPRPSQTNVLVDDFKFLWQCHSFPVSCLGCPERAAAPQIRIWTIQNCIIIFWFVLVFLPNSRAQPSPLHHFSPGWYFAIVLLQQVANAWQPTQWRFSSPFRISQGFSKLLVLLFVINMHNATAAHIALSWPNWSWGDNKERMDNGWDNRGAILTISPPCILRCGDLGRCSLAVLL